MSGLARPSVGAAALVAQQAGRQRAQQAAQRVER
jgi:hypothetical protein